MHYSKKVLCLVIIFLLAFGADLKGMELSKEELNQNMIGAIQEGNVRSVNLYLEQGANPDFAGAETGYEPAIIFALRQNTLQDVVLKQIIEILLSFNADARLPAENDNSALVEAIIVDRYPVVEVLLQAGFFQVSDRDLLGKTPLYYARIHNRPEIVSLLLRGGATDTVELPANRSNALMILSRFFPSPDLAADVRMAVAYFLLTLLALTIIPDFLGI